MRAWLPCLLIALAPALAHADKRFNKGRGGTWDCASDPVVHLNTTGNFTLTGACKEVHINKGKGTITIESAAELHVNGSGNTITVTAVDELHVNGSDNKIRYSKGVTQAAPEVHANGKRNDIAAAGATTGTAPTQGPVTGDATAGTKGPSLVYDCSKAPTLSITDGGGRYQLTGTCDEVSVVGGNNTIAAENIKKLSVAGSDNDIAVGAVDKISILGSGNKVSYRKGLSRPAPKIGDLGSDNKVSLAK